jgi:hypothetical protein
LDWFSGLVLSELSESPIPISALNPPFVSPLLLSELLDRASSPEQAVRAKIDRIRMVNMALRVGLFCSITDAPVCR